MGGRMLLRECSASCSIIQDVTAMSLGPPVLILALYAGRLISHDAPMGLGPRRRLAPCRTGLAHDADAAEGDDDDDERGNGKGKVDVAGRVEAPEVRGLTGLHAASLADAGAARTCHDGRLHGRADGEADGAAKQAHGVDDGAANGLVLVRKRLRDDEDRPW